MGFRSVHSGIPHNADATWRTSRLCRLPARRTDKPASGMTNDQRPTTTETAPPRFIDRALNWIERVGNTLPDPAALFLILLFVVWGLSAVLAPIAFTEIHPRTGDPIRVLNL